MLSSRIKSITKVGKKKTYDLHTPVYNNFFLANGILSHNSGKSYACLRECERLDPTFNADRICFEQNEFVKILKNKDLKPGSVIMWDEVGVGHNSKQWYSKFNKVINHVFQVFRRRNLIVFFTTPDFSFIDSDARKLLHGYFMTKGIDFDKKMCYTTFYQLQNNAFYGKLYHKRIRGNMGGIGKIMKTGFGMPSPELVKAYEVKKKAFDEKKLDDADLEQIAEDEKQAKKVEPPPHYVKIYEAYDRLRNTTKVANELGTSAAMITSVMKSMTTKFGLPYPLGTVTPRQTKDPVGRDNSKKQVRSDDDESVSQRVDVGNAVLFKHGRRLTRDSLGLIN